MRNRLACWILVLSAAALLTAGCGSSYSSSPTTPSAGGGADVLITILGVNGGMSFSPASVTVKVGQTVAWKNADSITHDIEQDAQGGFDTDSVPGSTTSKPIKMTTAGTLPYHCNIHPSMVGTLTVTQ